MSYAKRFFSSIFAPNGTKNDLTSPIRKHTFERRPKSLKINVHLCPSVSICVHLCFNLPSRINESLAYLSPLALRGLRTTALSPDCSIRHKSLPPNLEVELRFLISGSMNKSKFSPDACIPKPPLFQSDPTGVVCHQAPLQNFSIQLDHKSRHNDTETITLPPQPSPQTNPVALSQSS